MLLRHDGQRWLAKDNDLGAGSLQQNILQFFQSGAKHRDAVDLHQPADVQKRSGGNAVNIGKQPAFKLKTGKSHLMPSKWERGYLAGISLQAEAGPISNAHLKKR